jgi:hypothetical protein
VWSPNGNDEGANQMTPLTAPPGQHRILARWAASRMTGAHGVRPYATSLRRALISGG